MMNEGKAGRIRVGIGGWSFAPWRGAFYPDGLAQKRELAYASARLGSIEVNATYYGSQKPETFAKWHDETPDGFVFALKAPRFATNRRVLADAAESIERFFASGVLELKDKLGPINWQFMATKIFDRDDFGAFLRLLPSRVDGRLIRHAVEVRHESFAVPEFVALLRDHDVAVIVAGDAKHPQIADVTAPFVYARVMGTEEDKPEGYSPKALDAWAKRAHDWSLGRDAAGLERVAGAGHPAPRDVHLYVIGGAKVRNPAAAMALADRIG